MSCTPHAHAQTDLGPDTRRFGTDWPAFEWGDLTPDRLIWSCGYRSPRSAPYLEHAHGFTPADSGVSTPDFQTSLSRILACQRRKDGRPHVLLSHRYGHLRRQRFPVDTGAFLNDRMSSGRSCRFPGEELRRHRRLPRSWYPYVARQRL